jgi:broad specificity phosphatase PhoE
MEIYLIRHGEKKRDKTDPSLTPRGITQAKLLSKRLKKKKFDLVFSSDIQRAKETAEIIINKKKQKILIEKSLNEYRASLLKNDKIKWNNEEKENFKNLKLFLDSLSKKRNKELSILIIAHEITNILILSYLLELSRKNLIRFKQTETGINKLYWLEHFNNWRLQYWNDTNHLKKPDTL